MPPHRDELTRDQRIQIITLREAGFKYEQIRAYFLKKDPPIDISFRQIQYAINQGRPTPQKKGHVGRHLSLSEEQVDELEIFVCSSRTNRFLSYFQLSNGPFCHWEVSQDIIRKALKRRGYSRCLARQKPPLSDVNQRKRLAFALEHEHWTIQDWSAILWTDETWVTGGRHRRQWVTRKAGEELHPDCLLQKIPRRRGWMFWGSFAGGEKGPCVFWEKQWGSIGQVSYSERIIPVIQSWIEAKRAQGIHLLLMQDNAPSHSGYLAKEELLRREILLVDWPPYNPDLNPIKILWDWMKDWIEENYPDKQFSPPVLRRIIQEAWDAIPASKIWDLLCTMPQRIQDVKNAGGGYTKW